jgi:hypothetical protein
MSYFSSVYTYGIPDLSQFLFHRHGRIYLQKLHFRFQSGYIHIAPFVSKPALGNFYSIILVHEYGYALDVGLESLVTT